MKNKKNWVTLILIISSIVLLIGLQVVWLQSLYKDVKRDLRRETSILFSATVMAMQDSILEKNIKPLIGDSTAEIFGNTPGTRDSTRFRDRHLEIRMPRHDEAIYFGTARPDSLRKFFRPLMMKFRTNRKHRGFIIQDKMDSLKPEAVKKKYEMTLTKAGLPLQFKIERTNDRPSRKENNSTIVTEPFLFFYEKGSFYVARFSDVSFFIWKKLLPQFLFSIFLTSLTFAAFYLMYRNILSNQRLLEIKNDFISNMTHELKTPIATVSVALESLKSFNAIDNPQRTKEYIEMAQQELNRLSILTDKVLKTAIFESNGLTFQSEKVDLEKIVNHVIDSMRLMLEKKQAKINFLREGAIFFVNGNEDHLTNVVYNLLDNALKYSQEIPFIEVVLKSLDDKICLSVRDRGLGIAPEHQKRIFEKFYRVPTGDVVNTKGYGLGLSYVKSVARLHDGDVTIQSALGEGSTFIITLPKLRH
ncbi:MAG: GHKL domain-containing protein [Bacteroidetes bacterium]|nr:GHKL domain-containing protein [Bacteroidota bacterium]